MKGKKRCKILKEIRQAIADENGIEYVTTECKHKGDCAGTCPKCEQEVRYLEDELKKKQSLGKKIAVIGVAASVALSGTGCDDMLNQSTDGDIMTPEQSYTDVAGASSSPSKPIDMPAGLPGDENVIGEPPEESYPDESEIIEEDFEIQGAMEVAPESEETSSEEVSSREDEELEIMGDMAY